MGIDLTPLTGPVIPSQQPQTTKEVKKELTQKEQSTHEKALKKFETHKQKHKLSEGDKILASKKAGQLDLATPKEDIKVGKVEVEAEKVDSAKKKYHSLLVPTSKEKGHQMLKRSDLLTSPTVKSMVHSDKVGDCLLQTMSHTSSEKSSVLDQIVSESGAVSSQVRFQSMIKSLQGVVAKFKESSIKPNQDDLKLLEEIGKQINKGFSCNKGGVGSFHADKEWKKEWDKIGFKEENYKESLDKLSDMLEFYDKKSGSNFDVSAHHQAKIELTILSLESTIGQFVNDFLLDPKMKSSGILKEQFINNGSISKDFDKEIPDFQSKLRKNPLLAETKTDKLFEQINKGAGLDVFIKDKLEKYNNEIESKLNNDQLSKLTEGIMKEIKKTGDVKTSMRGRTQDIGGGKEKTKGFEDEFRGVDKDRTHFYSMPDIQDNENALQLGLKKIKGDDVNSFMKEIEDITKHDFQPKPILRLGLSLEGNMSKIVKDTKKCLRDVIHKVKEQEKDPKAVKLLEEFDEKINKDEALKTEIHDLQNKIQGVQVKYNDNDPQKKMKLIDLANRPTVANIMYKHNLKTICSISGTTTDIALSLASHGSPQLVNDILNPLLEHAKVLKQHKTQYMNEHHGGRNLDKVFEEAHSFKEVFARTTFFMQTGNYHTSGEVLGGMLIGALAASKKSFTDDEVFGLFEVLMENYSKHPENYFPLSKDEKKELFSKGHHKDTEEAIINEAVKRAQHNLLIGAQISSLETETTPKKTDLMKASTRR